MQDIEHSFLLLQDYQEGVVGLETMIEKLEGANFKTMSIFEEYCESVYQIYDKLSGSEGIEANKAYRVLK